MPKITLFLFLAILAVSGTSCKKDYTCTCTSSATSYTFDSHIKTTKKKAKEFCAAQATGTLSCELH
jgi:hypothetical protein